MPAADIQTIQGNASQPKINARFAEVLSRFKAVRGLDFTEEEIRKTFSKDELVALLIWFDEQLSHTEGVEQSDLFTEFEEIDR